MFLSVLVGDPNTSSFGVSFRGTAVPQLKLLGGETLVARLYMHCDDNEPQTTNGTNVGTIDLHVMTAGNQREDVLMTTQRWHSSH